MTEMIRTRALLNSPRMELGLTPTANGGYEVVLTVHGLGGVAPKTTLVAGPLDMHQSRSLLALAESHLRLQLTNLQQQSG